MKTKKVELTKKRFSEPELFLLRNWANARALEQSMEKVREKYKEVFGKVLDAVQEEHEELEIRVVQTAYAYKGYVGIAKRSWPGRYSGWPSGLWVGGIALESLVSEDEEDAPEAYITVESSKEVRVDMQRVERKLREGAEKILGKKQMKGVYIDVKKRAYLWYRLPEARRDLLEMLLSDNGDPFVKRMVEHFEWLARFIPVLDDIFRNGKAKRK